MAHQPERWVGQHWFDVYTHVPPAGHPCSKDFVVKVHFNHVRFSRADAVQSGFADYGLGAAAANPASGQFALLVK